MDPLRDLLIPLIDNLLPFRNLVVTFTCQLLRPLRLDGGYLVSGALLHLSPLPGRRLLTAQPPVLLVLLLDEAPNGLRLLLLHEQLELRHSAFIRRLFCLGFPGFIGLLLLDDVKFDEPCLTLLIGLEQPLSRLLLLELTLRLQGRQEAAPGLLAPYQGDVEFLVILGVELLEKFCPGSSVDHATDVCRSYAGASLRLRLRNKVLVIVLRSGFLRQAEDFPTLLVLDEVESLDHPMEAAILIGGIHQLRVILEEGIELAVLEGISVGTVILELVG
mmetsp:Transcript_61961/g.134277  ORF Transcript_61961/g.134277 Transcript_61961/m.134277 type:complete len:275 (+) Transcript_61961:904-1728(+)